MSRALATATFSLVLLLSLAADAQFVFQENFSTTTYRDAEATTADWNTDARVLQLRQYLPSVVGGLALAPGGRGVDVQGDLAFVAAHTSGLQVVDISAPAQPVVVGSWDSPGQALAVMVDGDLAYLADDGAGVRIIDIGDPASPVEVGHYDPPGPVRGLFVAGDLLFVSSGGDGLRIVDVTDPTAPALVSVLALSGSAYDVWVEGNVAYVAATFDAGGLHVVDVTDPADPVPLSFTDVPGWTTRVQVDGTVAYVASRAGGLLTYDVADPTSPDLLGTYATAGEAWGLHVDGDRLYLGVDSGELLVMDVCDPASPQLVHAVALGDAVREVVTAGHHAFVATFGTGLQVVEVSADGTMAVVGEYAGGGGYSFHVEVRGDRAYVTSSPPARLEIFDISDRRNPALLGSWDSGSVAPVQSLKVSGTVAYGMFWPGDIHMIDVQDPAAPTVIGTFEDNAADVEVRGDRAYVAAWNGFAVWDLTDPLAPVQLADIPLPAAGRMVVVSGDLALVPTGHYGDPLVSIDISDPADPVVLGSYAHPARFAKALHIDGDVAYVLCYDQDHEFNTLEVLDIGDPEAISSLGAWPLDHYASQLQADGDRLYVSGYDPGVLAVYDCSDPGDLQLVDAYAEFGHHAFGLQVAGDLAYLTGASSGTLRILCVKQSNLDWGANVGQSIRVIEHQPGIARTLVLPDQVGDIEWRLSTDGGWNFVPLENGWQVWPLGTDDLIWRTTHHRTQALINPSVSHISILWCPVPGTIVGIADAPGDQGGWVRLSFMWSGYDFEGADDPAISSYGIWRRVDDPELVSAIARQPGAAAAGPGGTEPPPDPAGLATVRIGERAFLPAAAPRGDRGFPAGDWEWIGSVPAIQHSEYLAAVPTVADSTAGGIHHTVLVVTTHTTEPSVWFACEPDSGYSVDNLAPSAPEELTVDYAAVGNTLGWQAVPDADLQCYRIYRAESPDFEPTDATLVHSTTQTAWVDAVERPWHQHYLVRAVDHAGNLGAVASPATVTAAAPVRDLALLPNAPNPFNPTTTLTCALPGTGPVRLRIYDVGGRLVRQLIADETLPAGRHDVVWNGRDDSGRAVASGSYYARLEAGGAVRTRVMTLIR